MQLRNVGARVMVLWMCLSALLVASGVWHVERRARVQTQHPPYPGRRFGVDDGVGRTAGDVACRERLGGLLRYYHRRAA